MRRGLLLSLAAGLLAAGVGCKSHGVCDCDATPIYDGPLPPASGHAGTAHYGTAPYGSFAAPSTPYNTAPGSEPIPVMPRGG
jgi:hypothetical protein